MSRFASSAALVFALMAGTAANEAFAGNGARIPIPQQNQAKIEQHRDAADARRATAAEIIRGFAALGRNRLSARQAASNNKAMTDQQGRANLAAIAQFGQNLSGSVAQNGTGNSATVRQLGRGNTTTIAQSGDNNAACIIQIGRNLDTNLVQTGDQSTALLQTRKGTREIPVEVCTAAANMNRQDARRLL